MVVVVGAIVGFAAVGGGFEFGGECGGPFLPGEMALLGELHGESEGLGLPRLGEDGTTGIAGKLRQSGKTLGFANRVMLGQGSRPIDQGRRNPVVRLVGPTVRVRRSVRSKRAGASRRRNGRWCPERQKRPGPRRCR